MLLGDGYLFAPEPRVVGDLYLRIHDALRHAGNDDCQRGATGDVRRMNMLIHFIDIAPVLLIPLWQLLVFVMIVSVAAVLERYKLILVLCYTFAMYWVFIENLKLMSLNDVSAVSVTVFVLFGLVSLLLTLYHALTSGR